ncbi:MAG: hypothetical protein JRN68_05135 [Nitrososphaerota archaeon]|nr:hypothetical protein [Nitrososphaerota archaeon]
MPTGGELVDFEAEGEEHWVKLKLKDGSVLKFKSVVSAIFRVGNDPNTGLPIYAIQTANIVRLASVPKELVVRKQVGSYG